MMIQDDVWHNYFRISRNEATEMIRPWTGQACLQTKALVNEASILKPESEMSEKDFDKPNDKFPNRKNLAKYKVSEKSLDNKYVWRTAGKRDF